jgi:hypothetical protein
VRKTHRVLCRNVQGHPRAGCADARTVIRPSFEIVLLPEPGVDGIRALLKAVLRRYGLRCTAINSEPIQTLRGATSPGETAAPMAPEGAENW